MPRKPLPVPSEADLAVHVARVPGALLVDVVVHVFDPITRAHYDLENLWGDAPRFPIAAPPASAPAAPAGETLSVYEAGTPS
jgi:hypothetical protein